MSENRPAAEPSAEPDSDETRRGFFKRGLAVVLGGVLSLFPVVVGIAAFVDPLRRRSRAMPGEDEPMPSDVPEGYVKVTTADALPGDGTPQFVRVIADRMDAWTYFPQQPIGSVFLRRLQDGSVKAFNSTCPHAGCAVDFRAGERNYYCPCHNSSFTLAGERSPSSPSPRNLDELDVLLRDGDVWVKYMEFRSGVADREEVT